MVRHVLLCLSLTLPVGMAHASGDGPHKLTCPVRAPSAWGGAAGALSGVEVLSAPRGTPIDDRAPPSLVPDEQTSQGGVLRQVWTMNADGPDWVYYVDCHYAGTPHILRLNAAGVTRCVRHVRAAQPAGPQSLACD